ncbi:23S rRNA (uracil(1939)-C(5))-methyltransferase RlmD [Mesohalobacter halotolerans]|uniref:23S rRNA (Uracil(1939)-C(5))-methyltransferase RlmD n=1 Tax=Mesohalobacter halotolerans TaxID=1883405 RepID=A0A4U5TQE0_9FLAO|nr:23S rRNA (uracil(1939)-C(5))-methyltransferase RlmD [Mesohalobacter halotolerans]MBS3738570.1 23S rRNA (uracil(1939)-C(5))-methyltransferase RlmD [Psychroflexus sp.]TKS56399.1 23S rRNA (uracil(1939)-C(5))-methyltransferase RlmD [Mesohalobacter halotolerans]
MGRRNRHKTFENLQVIDTGHKGKSVAKTDEGQVVFVDNAIPGDVVHAKSYKKRRRYFQAKPVEFVKFSKHRTNPVCEHFGTCGGCKWQNMKYEQQLFYKQKSVEDNLKRIGHLELPEISNILPSEDIYFYRNKMEFSFSNNRWLTQDEIESGQNIKQKNALGFHIPGMWDKILDLNTCHLQQDPSNAIRNEVKQFAIDHDLSFFDVKQQSGLLRTLMIRTTSTGEIMVLIQFYDDQPKSRKMILEHLKQKFPEITALLYVINQKPNDTIYDQDVICFYGQDFITEVMEELKFKIDAKSFYQTNSKQAYELYKITREFAQLQGKEVVYDLYTGTGTIAQFIAKNVNKVIGIEAVPEAIEKAKENTKANQIDNCEFVAGDMRKVFTKAFVNEHGQPDLIITDPPREGMHKDVVKVLLDLKPKRIVYVSCNSATQARDLEILSENYKITQVKPVDMFPQTHHVENVVALEIQS